MVDAGILGPNPLDTPVGRIALSVALGLFLGLEREWAQKQAGIRTFALSAVLGTMFTIYDGATCTATGGSVCLPLLSAVGGLFVASVAGVLMYSGLADADEGLHLTTAVSLLVAYGVGVLVGIGEPLPATVVAVASSMLLVFKRELHGFAWGLSREEIRSVSEFAIIAFVVFPLLPAEAVSLGSGAFSVDIEPRVVWSMVVFVAGIGIVNYVVVKEYGSRGIAVTGFFGGLASSTAVVGAMIDHVNGRAEAAAYGVAGILLADAAMALRNLLIVLVFTAQAGVLVGAAAPLAALIVASVAAAAWAAEWSTPVSMELDSPFSMTNALAFGALFLLVVVAGGVSGALFGTVGFYATAVLTGLVSSAGAVTAAVVLYRTGSLAAEPAIVAITLATVSSIVVKAALAATSQNRRFSRQVAVWSAVLVLVAGVVSAFVLV